LDVDARFRDAVQHFWTARGEQRRKQVEGGKIDAGTLDLLYRTACLTLTTDEARTKITEPSEELSFHRFVAALRGHVVTFLGSR